FQNLIAGFARDGSMDFLHGGFDFADGFGREHIALVIQKFLDMLAHGACLPDLFEEKPADHKIGRRPKVESRRPKSKAKRKASQGARPSTFDFRPGLTPSTPQ